ncbi:CII family transcriptional regulator [Escherichia coli]
MQLTSTRKKANAITSSILNRIAVRGQRKVADALGINELQISLWKDSFIPKWECFLLFLNGVLKTESWRNWLRKLAGMLTKEKAEERRILEA